MESLNEKKEKKSLGGIRTLDNRIQIDHRIQTKLQIEKLVFIDIIQKTILIVKSTAKSEKFGSPYSTFRMTDVFVFPFLLQNLTSDCIRFSDIYSIVIRILQNFQFSPFLESLANGFISLRRSFLFPRENFN